MCKEGRRCHPVKMADAQVKEALPVGKKSSEIAAQTGARRKGRKSQEPDLCLHVSNMDFKVSPNSTRSRLRIIKLTVLNSTVLDGGRKGVTEHTRWIAIKKDMGTWTIVELEDDNMTAHKTRAPKGVKEILWAKRRKSTDHGTKQQIHSHVEEIFLQQVHNTKDSQKF